MPPLGSVFGTFFSETRAGAHVTIIMVAAKDLVKRSFGKEIFPYSHLSVFALSPFAIGRTILGIRPWRCVFSGASDVQAVSWYFLCVEDITFQDHLQYIYLWPTSSAPKTSNQFILRTPPFILLINSFQRYCHLVCRSSMSCAYKKKHTNSSP